MKEIFVRYLNTLGIEGVIVDKVKEIYKFYDELYPNEIEDIFVSEYVKADSSREYENLWFLSKKHCFEAKQFITSDDFDSLNIENNIYYWTFKKNSYDFKTTTQDSRATLQFSVDIQYSGLMKASRENCNKLKEIMVTYIIPNTNIAFKVQARE